MTIERLKSAIFIEDERYGTEIASFSANHKEAFSFEPQVGDTITFKKQKRVIGKSKRDDIIYIGKSKRDDIIYIKGEVVDRDLHYEYVERANNRNIDVKLETLTLTVKVITKSTK